MHKLTVLAFLAAVAFAACGGATSGSSPGAGASAEPASTAESSLSGYPLITMPIEVLGAAGTIREVIVPLPGREVSAGGLKISVQVHNLSYDDKGSVQINGSSWIPLRNDTVSVAEPGKSYGGIGGGFHTLTLTIDVPAGAAVAGANTIRFRFNGTDGVSIGYRVLRLNVLDASRRPLVPDAMFVADDPNTWTAPDSRASAIAEGKRLWLDGALQAPNGAPLQAHCADCHAKDGRDLHYFNYSNTSIIERARFHQLTEEQGRFIASYIRARPAPSPAQRLYPNPDPHPGRPWNPPFQPGPGVDSRPFNEWSAGAGIGWVLDSDADMMPYLFPNGITKERIARDADVNAREIPIALQFPDWNHWLPRTHPRDAWGGDWDASHIRQLYDGGGEVPSIREVFAKSLAEDHAHVSEPYYQDYVSGWNLRIWQFLAPRQHPGEPESVWTVEHARKIYDTSLWHNVKTWEVVQEFQVEGNKMRPSERELRSWVAGRIFDTAPHLLHLPPTKSGVNTKAGDDAHNRLMFTYFSADWYQLQLTMDPGNSTDGQYRSNQRPVD
ncbi:hypothetical protein [Pendulispora albinea]|uniref:Cytochrome c domain-containing protein n=1 Tax=Pendulispora albinea TaxID=2741071 RepID=A0ABZ2M2V1_9BACT